MRCVRRALIVDGDDDVECSRVICAMNVCMHACLQSSASSFLLVFFPSSSSLHPLCLVACPCSELTTSQTEDSCYTLHTIMVVKMVKNRRNILDDSE